MQFPKDFYGCVSVGTLRHLKLWILELLLHLFMDESKTELLSIAGPTGPHHDVAISF